jgi:hypothetical protein
MKNLVTYIEIHKYKVIKRVLLDGIEPTLFLTGMNKLCYPIAISPLTNKQFKQMCSAFPAIEVVRSI